MTFSQVFSQYLCRYQITLSLLSAETGLSRAMLSRMKNGKKEPPADSPLLERLSAGIAALAKGRGDGEVDAGAVKEALGRSLHAAERFDLEHIVRRLNLLIGALDLRAGDLSRHLNFDPSYLSLIRSGKRRPADIAAFCAGVADFVSTHCGTDLPLLSSVLGCRQSELSGKSARQDAIYRWLLESAPQAEQPAMHFLRALDSFDLNEYIGALQFGADALPANIDPPPMQKTYYTQKGFMQAELDWLQAVIASPGAGPVLFYSDMPIAELSGNAAFSKQWMMGLALLLKKGVHLHMIHQMDRQTPEMMLGLEAWIPLYMTGQVSPYYLSHNKSPYFHHFLRTSDEAVLSGEAITGFYSDGRYRFSRCREDVDYCKKRGEALLSKAQPLMAVYRRDSASDYRTFLALQRKKASGPYRNILSAPPIYTISAELLRSILAKNHASRADVQKITSYAAGYRQWVQTALSGSSLADRVFVLSRDDFRSYPASLPLSDLFPEREYTYDYEDYLAHLQQTEAFARQDPRYSVTLTGSAGFRNLQIRMAEDSFVLVSKEKCPTIHFVIHHPALRSAVAHLNIPVVEQTE